MLLSLLQVGLLTMGVGVRTSAPICLDSQPQIEQNENNLNIQKNNANEDLQEFSNTLYTNTITSVDDDTYRYENINYVDITRNYQNTSSEAITTSMYKHTTAQQLFYTPTGSQAEYLVYYPLEFYPSESYVITVNPNYPTKNTYINLGLDNNIDIENPEYSYELWTSVRIETRTENAGPNNYTLVDEFETKQTSPLLIRKQLVLQNTEKTYIRIQVRKWIKWLEDIVVDYNPEGDLYDTLIKDYGIDPLLNHTWRPEISKLNANRITISGEYTTSQIVQEIVDIPGMMWTILTMPFSFISTAFNLTLFPNTPYAINVSNLVLTIFGVLVFIFIFKLLIKK